ncbi:MAG: nucleotidyltransferase family protein [Blautia faecicola]
MRIRMIYMAAGNSRRFGSNKLFYLIDGKPMYLHVLERLSAVCKRHRDWEIVLVSQYEELLEQGRAAGTPNSIFSGKQGRCVLDDQKRAEGCR